MKKVLILLALIIVAMVSYSTNTIRTIKSNKVLSSDITAANSVTWKYTGLEIDSLTINQDTLLYNITVNKSVPANYYIKIGLDTIAGVDTTCVINIKGRMFDDEVWSLVETVTTSVVNAEINTVIESITDADFTMVTASHTSSNPSHTLASLAFAARQDTTGFANYPADSIKFPVITFTEGTQTITEQAATATPTVSIKPSYRQIQVEIILNGDDSVGEGIALKDIEWYFQEAK